jgi:DNA mismatch endonuclease (patch repair protein)
MVAAKPRDTKPELALRAALEEQGLTFTVDVRPDPATRRRADILFERVRVAVYVDGCFWHGCPLHGTWPKQNAEFWRNKIETNQQRDVDTDRKLTEAGWCVIRVWEHEVMAEAARRIAEIVSKLDHTQRPPQLDLARS